jgi:invasion protein IalB
MRVLGWVIVSVVGVSIGGAAAVLATRGGAIGTVTKPVMSDQAGQVVPVAQREAQNRPVAPGTPAAPQRPQAPQAQQAPQAPQGPRRTETTEYGSWVVTCDNTDVNGKPNRSCIASLRLLNKNREVMLSWDIGSDPQGQWVTAIHVPPGLTVKDGDKTVASPPIMVTNGVDLKFGNSAARRLTYVSCGPQQCLALASIDDAFVKDALANANGKASITIYTGGGAVPFDVSIKGIDTAITSTRK